MQTYRTRSWRAFKPGALSDGGDPAAGATATSVRVLGLDPGSRCTGFGIIDFSAGNAVHVTSGAIRITGESFPERLQEIFARVRELVIEFHPAEVAIERVFVNKNADSALKLGQARGAALCGAFSGMVRVFEYSPREIKMAVVGSGGAEKTQVQHMVKALLHVESRLTADAADALAVALCHVHGRRLRHLLRAP
ncbi:MAG TPA: crossover junction endodeoxyribonuclease RuvC [Steroidobacteraceae bacterium]|nr:crossover junction endodeoxyribonuclease RuvC [Steroidobacteraceae bacterium]